MESQDVSSGSSNPKSTHLTTKQRSWFSWWPITLVCTGEHEEAGELGRPLTMMRSPYQRTCSQGERDCRSPCSAVSCSPGKHPISRNVLLTDFLPRSLLPKYRNFLRAVLHIKTNEISGNNGGLQQIFLWVALDNATSVRCMNPFRTQDHKEVNLGSGKFCYFRLNTLEQIWNVSFKGSLMLSPLAFYGPYQKAGMIQWD